MDYLKCAFETVKKEKLNFDDLIELFGNRAQVETVTKALLNLYFDYTRALLLSKRDDVPLISDVEKEIFWLRNLIETLQKMREPDGRIRIEM